MEFKKYKLGDCFRMAENGLVIKQTKAAKGMPITRIETLSNDCFNRDRLGYGDIFDEEKYSHYILDDKDLLMSHINSRTFLGRTVLYRKRNGEKIIHGMNVLRIKTNQDILDPIFASYLFRTSLFKRHIDNIRKDAINQSSFALSDLKNIELYIPTVKEQNKIAYTLQLLDSKIALNRQINDNLEAMAKQLYDYWFVQFDFPNEEGKPYKSSGGAMVWNEKLKREIPQGWNDCKIKDFMRIFTGKKDVSKAVPGNYKFFSCAPEPISSNEYIYDGYAVLVSGNGSYTGRVGFYKGKFDLYQRTYACVLDEDEHNISFFYYTLRYLFQPIYSGGKHGSSIPYIVLGDLADFRFAFNETICTKFVDAAKPMFDEQLLRQKEIEALTKQRDELLPLLMNGQASVNYHLYVFSRTHFILFLSPQKYKTMNDLKRKGVYWF